MSHSFHVQSTRVQGTFLTIVPNLRWTFLMEFEYMIHSDTLVSLMPDSSWMPKRYVGENTTGLTIGDVSSAGHFYIFNASHAYYTGEWDWGKEQANVENDFNVIKTGKVHLLGQSRPLNIVHFQIDSPQTISFYISIIDTLNRSNYTLNLTTDYGEGYESRICEMKPILESFKIHQ